MEAIAAIGLAANILQFINLVGDVLSTSKELYHSTTGLSSEHEEKVTIIQDLKVISKKIQLSADLQNPSAHSLYSSCDEVAEELLATLTSLQVTRKHKKLRTLCNALRSAWGREKIARLESRLIAIRQELGFHILFEMKAQQSLSSVEGRRCLTMLDQATKQGLTETLAALQDNSNRIITAIGQHAEDSQSLHLERHLAMSQQIDALANSISNHNEQAQASTVTQKAGHGELLDAIEQATATNTDGILNASESVHNVVKDENADTRAAMTDLAQSNHEIMKQEINELQHGLQKLQVEIGRKVDELKDLVLKIDSTAEGAERRLLRKRGNTVTVTLMSLHELYRSLQELLESLLQKGNIAVEAVTKRAMSNVLRARAYAKILMSLRRDDDTTLQMYYEWYYAPYFHERLPRYTTVEFFEMSAIKKWSLELDRFVTKVSPEYITLSKAAVQGDTLIWTLVGLAGAVYSCLPCHSDVVSVLALVFSILNDPSTAFKASSKSIPMLVQDLLPMFQNSCGNVSSSSDTPTTAMTSRFQRCRYNPKSTLGKRLHKDVRLWLKVAADAGLPRVLDSDQVPVSDHGGTEIACTLLGLLQQPRSWITHTLPPKGGHFDRLVILRNHRLWIGSEAKLAMHLLRQLQAVGINLNLDDGTTIYPPSGVSMLKPVIIYDWTLMHQQYMRTGSWWGGPYERLLDEVYLRGSIPPDGFTNGQELPQPLKMSPNE